MQSEGEQLRQLIRMSGKTVEEASVIFGKTRRMLYNYFSMNKLDADFKEMALKKLMPNVSQNENIFKESQEESVRLKSDKGTQLKDIVQLRAMAKINRHAVAKLMAKVFDREVEDCLDELDADTRIVIKELIGEQ